MTAQLQDLCPCTCLLDLQPTVQNHKCSETNPIGHEYIGPDPQHPPNCESVRYRVRNTDQSRVQRAPRYPIATQTQSRREHHEGYRPKYLTNKASAKRAANSFLREKCSP